MSAAIPILHADGVTLRNIHDHVVAVVCTGDAAFDAELARHIARTLNSAPRPKPGTLAAVERATACLTDLKATLEDELHQHAHEVSRLRDTLRAAETEAAMLRPLVMKEADGDAVVRR